MYYMKYPPKPQDFARGNVSGEEWVTLQTDIQRYCSRANDCIAGILIHTARNHHNDEWAFSTGMTHRATADETWADINMVKNYLLDIILAMTTVEDENIPNQILDKDGLFTLYHYVQDVKASLESAKTRLRLFMAKH